MQVCHNDGVCVLDEEEDHGPGYHCQCQQSYTGQHCQVRQENLELAGKKNVFFSTGSHAMSE